MRRCKGKLIGRTPVQGSVLPASMLPTLWKLALLTSTKRPDHDEA